jgi:4-carboxymuconolactone decarboxylase
MNDIVRPSSPRIHPLPPGERDAESRVLIDRIGSSATGNTFETLVRHPNLLRQWMPFTVALAVTGVLPPRLRELAILRTGWLRAEYEWGQHVVLARRVGISNGEIARVKSGPEAEGWTELEAAVLRAVDELHSDACVTDNTWAVLAAHLDERQLIEVCLCSPVPHRLLHTEHPRHTARARPGRLQWLRRPGSGSLLPWLPAPKASPWAGALWTPPNATTT